MKKIEVYIGYLLVTVIIIFLLLDYFNVGAGSNCRRRTKRIEVSKIEGVVLNKYLDKNNHMFETLILMDNDKNTYITLPDDESGIFNFIEKEDSLLKEQGTLKCKVKKKGIDYYFIIDLGCNK
jgi:hypothetical protein